MRRRPLPLVLAAGIPAALALSGCSSEAIGPSVAAPGTTARPTAPTLPTAPALPTCAPAAAASLTWPVGVPADLPKPPGANGAKEQSRKDGLTVVTFSTATSLREGVQFLVKALPAAGYTVGRGDAETTEADVPFVKDGLRGVLRMVAVEQCRTDWLLAVTSGAATTGGSPLLPSRPSASPLPFG